MSNTKLYLNDFTWKSGFLKIKKPQTLASILKLNSQRLQCHSEKLRNTITDSLLTYHSKLHVIINYIDNGAHKLNVYNNLFSELDFEYGNTRVVDYYYY